MFVEFFINVNEDYSLFKNLKKMELFSEEKVSLTNYKGHNYHPSPMEWVITVKMYTLKANSHILLMLIFQNV